jgi:hypothetical protein
MHFLQKLIQLYFFRFYFGKTENYIAKFVKFSYAFTQL